VSPATHAPIMGNGEEGVFRGENDETNGLGRVKRWQ
jgi:hypothetical protein